MHAGQSGETDELASQTHACHTQRHPFTLESTVSPYRIQLEPTADLSGVALAIRRAAVEVVRHAGDALGAEALFF